MIWGWVTFSWTGGIAGWIWGALAEPWQTGIGARAFLEMILIAPLVGTLGTWITLYRLSYAAESLSHALLPGLVLAAVIGIPLVSGAGLAALAAAVLLALAVSATTVGRDTAVAVVVTTFFAAGVFLDLAPQVPPRLQDFLFGHLLGVSSQDLVLTASLTVTVLLGLKAFHRNLILASFDRASARSLGVSPASTDMLLLLMLAATVAVAVQGLGNLLVAGILLAPASAARLLAARLFPTMVLATILVAAAGMGGLYISYYVETAVGSSIVLTAVTLFLIVWVVTAARLGPPARRAHSGGTPSIGTPSIGSGHAAHNLASNR